jgi:flagellar motor switch protein FliM
MRIGDVVITPPDEAQEPAVRRVAGRQTYQGAIGARCRQVVVRIDTFLRWQGSTVALPDAAFRASAHTESTGWCT